MTPYARLVATGVLSAEWRPPLEARYAQTNPRQLRRTIYVDLARLWAIPQAQVLAADEDTLLGRARREAEPGALPVTLSLE